MAFVEPVSVQFQLAGSVNEAVSTGQRSKANCVANYVSTAPKGTFRFATCRQLAGKTDYAVIISPNRFGKLCHAFDFGEGSVRYYIEPIRNLFCRLRQMEVYNLYVLHLHCCDASRKVGGALGARLDKRHTGFREHCCNDKSGETVAGAKIAYFPGIALQALFG